MLKSIPKILWALLGTVALILAGVLGTSPAVAKNGVVQAECNIVNQVSFGFFWENDSSENKVFVFDTGIPGEPITTDTMNPGEGIDFGRGLDTPMDGNAYTMTITLNDVLVYEAGWTYTCPWQGLTVTVDTFTAATDPSPTPSPTVTPTPTSTVEPTPTVPVTVEPTPSVTPTQPAPQPQAVKGLKVKVKKTKVKATWKSGTATKWQCKTKVVKGKTKVKPKKRTVTSAKCTFKVKPKTKKAKVKVSVREVGGPYKAKTVKLKV